MSRQESLKSLFIYLYRAKLARLFLLMFVFYSGVSWYILEVIITPKRIINTITPEQLGLQATNFISFHAPEDGLRLQGWLVPTGGKKVVVLLHGVHSYAWDGNLVELTHAYTRSGIDVLLFDLRGHGWSDGTSVGLGIREKGDVRAAVDELLERGYDPGKIGIHGLSYGAAVALLAASEVKEIGAIVADSSFADVRDVVTGEIQRETGLPAAMAELCLPGIRILARLIYSIDIAESAPERIIGTIDPRPVLLIHGTEDNFISFDQANRLKAAAGANVELWPLVGYRHTEGLRLAPGYPEWSPMRERYLDKVTDFFHSKL